jgi:hypothetical protein
MLDRNTDTRSYLPVLGQALAPEEPLVHFLANGANPDATELVDTTGCRLSGPPQEFVASVLSHLNSATAPLQLVVGHGGLTPVGNDAAGLDVQLVRIECQQLARAAQYFPALDGFFVDLDATFYRRAKETAHSMAVFVHVSTPHHSAAEDAKLGLALTVYRAVAESFLERLAGGKLGRWLARSGFDAANFHTRLFVQSRGVRARSGSMLSPTACP